MTGPHPDAEDTKQISVAELLARNGTGGTPTATRRRRRRRGDDSISVAELTGEIPVIRDEPREKVSPEPRPAAAPAAEPEVRETPAVDPEPEVPAAYWAEPEPRWPRSEPLAPRKPGPERSQYPRPLRQSGATDAEQQSGAEHMSPDPVGHYTDASVDVMDSEVRDAESVVEDSAYVRSYLHGADADETPDDTLFGGQSLADEVARRRSDPLPAAADDAPEADQGSARRSHGRMAALGRALLTVLQSILAVAFGGGLFIAFDQLWRWNPIVALVLSVLVILGLVVGVRVVRKTEDIASTLIAVAVGALITLGPMALLQTS